MVKLLLLLIILILVNAFLAASEVSVVSLNKNRLRELAEDGDRKAQRLLKFAEEPNIFLSTIQVGITLAGFLASAAAADGFAGKLMAWLYERLGTSGISLSVCHVLAVVLVTVVLSYFALLFGELVPRRIAMQRPEAAERMTCSVVGVLTVVLHPAVWLLSRSAKLILKLLHFKTESVERSVTEEEIRRLVDLGGEKGTIDHDEQEWIQNVFRFDDISVRDAMTREADMVCFSLDEADEDIISTIRESGLSRYPVYDEDINDIIGILNARDYLLDRKNDSPSGLKELLREPYFVPDTIHADDLFRDMQKGKSIWPSLSTNTDRRRGLLQWRIFWRRSSEIFTMSSIPRSRRKSFSWRTICGGSQAAHMLRTLRKHWIWICRRISIMTRWAA